MASTACRLSSVLFCFVLSCLVCVVVSKLNNNAGSSAENKVNKQLSHFYVKQLFEHEPEGREVN